MEFNTQDFKDFQEVGVPYTYYLSALHKNLGEMAPATELFYAFLSCRFDWCPRTRRLLILLWLVACEAASRRGQKLGEPALQITIVFLISATFMHLMGENFMNSCCDYIPTRSWETLLENLKPRTDSAVQPEVIVGHLKCIPCLGKQTTIYVVRFLQGSSV